MGFLFGFILGVYFELVEGDAIFVGEFFMAAVIGNDCGDVHEPFIGKVSRENVVDAVGGMGVKDGHFRFFVGKVELPAHLVFAK